MALRSNRPYRRRAPRPTPEQVPVAAAQERAREALNVAQTEPHNVVWQEAANAAYEVYEAECRARGLCRAFGCYRRTPNRRCREHRGVVDNFTDQQKGTLWRG